jgi:hypothetical protein
MKRETFTVKLDKPKRRHQFLFNDGEFKPRQENIVKIYRRREKHRGKIVAESMNW